MRGWIKYVAFAFLMLLIVLWLSGFFAKKEKAGEIKEEKATVDGLLIGSVEKVSEVSSPYSGQVVADKRIEITTRVMGRVKGVFVEEGQRVRLGQRLVEVDAEDIKAQILAINEQIAQAEQALRSAMANYEAVQRTFERYSRLLKEGAITQQEFDQVKAQYESARAQVEQARAGIRALQNQRQAVASNLKYTSLVSPVDGYVAQRQVDVGDMAMPGQPLLVIESPPYLFEVFLPERFVNRVKVGQEYEVYVPSLGKRLKAKVKEVSLALDPSTRTFKVKLELEQNKDLRSGMYGSLLIPERVEALLVPESAIVKRFDFTGVWVVRPDNTLELRFVKLGERRGDKVEVLSGLKEGERIVIKGIERACEGCKVGG